MDFRGLATRIRAQAKDAVSKIPNLDDMAATDDYIHREDFNVRGQPKVQKREESVTEREVMPPSETSWSLLDKPTRGRSAVPTSRETPEVESMVASEQSSIASRTSENKESDLENGHNSRFEESDSVKKQALSSPLLSVVASALEEPDEKREYSDEDGSESDSGDFLDSHSDNDSLDAVEDEDDPILSLIRQNKTPKSRKVKQTRQRRSKSPDITTIEESFPSKETTKNPKTKSPNRFMDDLDRRLATPEDQIESGVVGALPSTQNQQPVQSLGTIPVGKWFKNVATARINQYLKRSDIGSSVHQSTKSLPPLARQRPQVLNETNKPEEDFLVTASSSVLADDELAQLARLKQFSTENRLSIICRENRQFFFIAFTLVLSIFIYFYSRQTLEDDVT